MQTFPSTSALSRACVIVAYGKITTLKNMICLTDQPLNCCQNVEREKWKKKWLQVSDENGLKNHMSITSCRLYVASYCTL